MPTPFFLFLIDTRLADSPSLFLNTNSSIFHRVIKVLMTTFFFTKKKSLITMAKHDRVPSLSDEQQNPNAKRVAVVLDEDTSESSNVNIQPTDTNISMIDLYYLLPIVC